MNDISVVVPAYNEELFIGNTINALKQSKLINRIIVVDDGSKDKTAKIASELGVEVIKLIRNKGKGYALRVGINRVILDSKIIVFIDADLGDSAKEVDKLITPVLEKQCDVSIARFKSSPKSGGFGLVKKLSKYGVKIFTKIETNCSLSGQRAFSVEVLEKIKYIPSSFGIEVSMIIDVLNMGYNVHEVDVNMTHNETGRNIKGFIHRGKQFNQIFVTLIEKGWR